MITRGIFVTLSAYVLWGFLPLYWKTIQAVTPLHILACRILFSLIFVTLLLLWKKNTSWVQHFRDPKKLVRIVASAVLICGNWGVYIYAVNSGHTLQASLGYYINPLVSVLLALVVMHEKLKPLQWVAFALATTGVAILTAFTGAFPWIALVLAVTFALYGLCKKTLPFSALEGLATETLASLPLALLLFGMPPGVGDITGLSPGLLAALALAGPITAVPLYLFAKGAKLIPLGTVGFLQFASPTLQFLCGVFVFHEAFPLRNLVPFSLIWVAAILYIVSASRGVRTVPRVSPGTAP